MQSQESTILEGYLTLDQTAKELGIHIITLRRWKARRYGPQPMRVGARWYYKRDDWRAFFEKESTGKGRKGRP